MTDNLKDGGPAFAAATGDPNNGAEWQEGMSLRDWLAGRALTGMISTAAAPCVFGLSGAEEVAAKAAYRIADAMIAARGEAA